jgi:uncharacterized membrane protein
MFILLLAIAFISMATATVAFMTTDDVDSQFFLAIVALAVGVVSLGGAVWVSGQDARSKVADTFSVEVIGGSVEDEFVARLPDGTLAECSVTRDERHLVCGGEIFASRP